MIISIKTLTAEKNIYIRELENLKNINNSGRKSKKCGDTNKQKNKSEKNSKINNCIFNDKDLGEIPERIEPGKESVHRRKDNMKKNILILGDSHSIDFLNILNNIVPDDYIVQTIIKHNAQLEDIIEDLRTLTKTFTLSDYVILSGGLTDALRGKIRIMKEICRIISEIENRREVGQENSDNHNISTTYLSDQSEESVASSTHETSSLGNNREKREKYNIDSVTALFRKTNSKNNKDL
ncbi:hypothetical protein JTB14_024094 [Gonioctena quinquepunctata]|nr:hypothetical protein JTB14_024094 [Gonioctena quinquepunctata]